MTSLHDQLLVCVGVAALDTIAVVESFPASDERTVATSLTFAGGGPAATAAVAAARLGIRAAVVSAVGDDEAGRALIAGLAAEGVDTSAIAVVSDVPSCQSVVVISQDRQHRAIINCPGPALAPTAAATTMLAAASWVHTDQHGWAATQQMRAGGGSRARLSVDAGNHIDGLDLADVDLYAPTRLEIERRYPEADSVDDALRRAHADGCRAVVVSDGAHGSYALWADGTSQRQPTLRTGTAIASTLGAGDVFHGALLAGLIRHESEPESLSTVTPLAYATAIASLSCAGIDGRSAVPRHTPDLIARLSSFETTKAAE